MVEYCIKCGELIKNDSRIVCDKCEEDGYDIKNNEIYTIFPLAEDLEELNRLITSKEKFDSNEGEPEERIAKFKKFLQSFKDEFGLESLCDNKKITIYFNTKVSGFAREKRLFRLAMEAGVYEAFDVVMQGGKFPSTLKDFKAVLGDNYYISETGINAIMLWFASLFLDIDDIGEIEFWRKENNKRYKEFYDGIQNGQLFDAKGNCTYEGGLKNSKRHGLGTSFYSNGQREYVGDWKDDKRHGAGALYSENGDMIYNGGWVEDHKEGWGTSYTAEGPYTGSFKNDQKFDQGVKGDNEDSFQMKQDWKTKELHSEESFLIYTLKNLYTRTDNQIFLKDNFDSILKLANENNADAQYQMGKCHEQGIVINRDIDKALYWYKKSADNGNSLAVYSYGLVVEQKTKFENAIPYYEEALKQGEIRAALKLGCYYVDKGKQNVDKDLLLEADTYFKKGVLMERKYHFLSDKNFLENRCKCAQCGLENIENIIILFVKGDRFHKDFMSYNTKAMYYKQIIEETERMLSNKKDE